jgi:hypothetical protein
MSKLVEILTIRERRRFESIPTSWGFIPNTNLGNQINGHLMSPLVQIRSIHGSDQHCTLRDTTGCQVDQDSNLPLASHRLPLHPYYLQCAHFDRMIPGQSWATRLHGWNDLSVQLSERHAFNLDRSVDYSTILNQHRQNHYKLQHHQHIRFRPVSSYNSITWLFPW